MRLKSILLTLCLGFSALGSHARNNDFELVEGPKANLPAGTIVDGSVKFGGLQPDYLLDFDNPAFARLRKKMSELKSSEPNLIERIRKVREYVSNNGIKYRDYDNKAYLNLMKEFRRKGETIPLSKYFICRSGTCREDAFILHYALTEAGISNTHYYMKVNWGVEKDRLQVTEDHAFCVVEVQGEKYAVDANSPRFNGYRLDDLLSPEGVTKNSKRLPFARPWNDYKRKVVKIHDFPVARIPVGCRNLLEQR